MPAGIVTIVDPPDDAPDASAGTLRVWSAASPASRNTLFDRKNCVVDAAAFAAPAFVVVSETTIDVPGPATLGAVMVDTCRSGPMATVVTRVLLNSFVSASV